MRTKFRHIRQINDTLQLHDPAYAGRRCQILIFFLFVSPASTTFRERATAMCVCSGAHVMQRPYPRIYCVIASPCIHVFTIRINIYDRLLKVIERIEKCWPINWRFYYTGSLWPSFECTRHALSYIDIVCWREIHPNNDGMRACVRACARVRHSWMTTAIYSGVWPGISLHSMRFGFAFPGSFDYYIGLWYRLRFFVS